MSTVLEVSDLTFDAEVLKSLIPVVVDFWAAWCGPCKMLAPKLDELSVTYGTKIKFVKLNVDDNAQTPAQFGIQGIPALLLFKSGKKVDQLVGNLPKESIEEFLKQVL